MQVMIVLLSVMVALGAGFTDSTMVSSVMETEAIAISEATSETAAEEVSEEMAEIAALEAEGYMGQIPNEIIDVDTWHEEFMAIWNDEHEDMIEFTVVEPEEDDTFPTLLMADLDSALYLQMNYAPETEIYWYLISFSEENTPVRKQAQYEDYFYSAITTGLMAHYDDMTIREHKDIDAMAREYAQALQSGMITADETWFSYLNTLIGFGYDEELGLFECYIAF